jgi:hypothetical protein
LLNFFKVQVIDVREIRDPCKVALNYLKGSFLFDVISVLPYTIINPWMIFLRNLKFLKYSTYQSYIEDYIVEQLQDYVDKIIIEKVMSIVELIIQLAVIANFFASIWLLIGQYNYYEKDSGWIKYNHEVLKI